ncbi:MAG: DNA repair protein RecN [Kiritimatiellae bacterium]|nr:DNA repair protein RecN [Kiritimatiellia bacterium]
MLARLSVRNLAVVENAEADFASGLNVITGETGAGKSVLMGALRLLTGGRADRTAIRTNATEASVSAVYEVDHAAELNAVLADLELPLCEDGILLLRRSLKCDGTGKVRINDAPATAAALRRLAPYLTDIHGPDDNLTLLAPEFQLRLLTAYADATAEQADYSEKWQTLKALKEELLELTGDPERRDYELTRLRETLADIDAVNPTEEDGDALTEQHAQVANAEAILADGNSLLNTLSEGDNPIATQLINLHRPLRDLARLLPEAATWGEALEDIQERIQELSRTISGRLASIDADPAALAQLESRLAQIQRLRRRYGPTLEDVLAHRQAARAKLEALADSESAIHDLKVAITRATQDLIAAGEVLRAKRLRAIPQLSAAITEELRDLGFSQASFPIQLEALDEPAPSGLDRVIFCFEPNPGESARPLAAIASSGEIARVMLAVKVILARHDAIDTLVFDEIDANIGGETGRKVGLKLRQLAEQVQIICITHQPQAAVYGQHHLRVRKAVNDGQTQTFIEPLDETARATEIARMLGGEDFTPITREHAIEMLHQAAITSSSLPSN